MMKFFSLLMVLCGLALPAFACAEHEAEAAAKAKAEAAAHPDFAAYVPSDSCNGIDYYDFGSATDGAAYYVSQDTQQVLDVCGGACHAPAGSGQCEQCPPKAWNCGDVDITPAVKR